MAKFTCYLVRTTLLFRTCNSACKRLQKYTDYSTKRDFKAKTLFKKDEMGMELR